MPTSVEPVVLLDTSAALAWVDDESPHFEALARRLDGRALGLAGHAAAEMYSVLTRLPGPRRLSGADALALIEASYPHGRFLPEEAQAALVGELAAQGILGGAVYDGLVARAARHHGATLVTCDRRAVSTYTKLGVDFELILGDR